jgi:class 3 adenylate cyclase
MAGNNAFQEWWGRFERLGATPAACIEIMRLNSEIDVSPILPSIHVPTQGREVKSLGDGFLATFDGPARAIHCATSIITALRSLGLQIRAGIHTGEVEIAGDDIRGIAVHITSRVASLGGWDDIVVSRTIKDIVAGSGITFEDFGIHVLKGVPEDWQLYRVADLTRADAAFTAIPRTQSD